MLLSSPATALHSTMKAVDFAGQCDLLSDRERIQSREMEPSLYSSHEVINFLPTSSESLSKIGTQNCSLA